MNIKERILLNKITHSVRTAQVILQYGVGAMIDFPDQTLVTAAPTYWQNSIRVYDDRLAKAWGYATTHPYTSDVSAVLEARQPLLANITMPEYTRTSSYLNGVTRLFSQQKRDSARTYSQLQPNSTTYNNTANLISTNFTVSQNRVLTANGYQSSGGTPTNAVSAVTAAACTKLKNTYGNNLRIYVIKYKAQEKYNSFPYADKASTATAHNYTAVDRCASSSSYLYSASTPDELNEALNAIATNIKSASFGNWQRAQNVE